MHSQSTDIILALSDAFEIRDPELRRQIRALRDATLTDKLITLTRIEKTPGLPVDLFGLIAAAKLALQFPDDEEKQSAFWRRSMWDSGIIPG